MSVEVCRSRFVRELEQLRARFPDDGVLIGSYERIVDGNDDVVFGLLTGLVGPSVPGCADELWGCVSGFLRDRRRVELSDARVGLSSSLRGRYSRYTPPSARPVIRLHEGESDSGSQCRRGWWSSR